MKSISPAADTIIRAWPADHSSVSSQKRTGLVAGRRPLIDAWRQAKRPGALGPRTATKSERRNQRLRFFAHPSGGVRGWPTLSMAGKWGALFAAIRPHTT